MKYPFVLSLILSFCISSCIEDEKQEPKDLERVVLIYCAGDNNLSYSLGKIAEQISKGWEYTGNRCLIYYDSKNDVPKLLSIRGGCCENPTPYIEVVESYEEENSASAAVLERVIKRVKELHPAPSYGLIFTSHASGWLPEGSLKNPTRSIGQDNDLGSMADGSSEIELCDFAKAIPDSTFDYIIFEACLMAGVEVAYELKNKTAYILASSAELLEPGFVNVYSKTHRYLMNNKLSIPKALESFATDYYKHTMEQSGAWQATTLSLIKTSELEKLADISTKVFTSESENKINIKNLQRFDRPGSYGDSPASPKYFDMQEYIEQLSPSEQNIQFAEQMEKTVIWKAATPEFMITYNGFKIKRHCGLTIYIPQTLFPDLNEAYENTTWQKKIKANH